MIAFLKLLNKKFGESKFFQCIVRDYLKKRTMEKDKVLMTLGVVNK